MLARKSRTACRDTHLERAILLLADTRVDPAAVIGPAGNVTMPLIRLAQATKCCRFYLKQFQDLEGLPDLLDWKDRILVKKFVDDCPDTFELITALAAILKKLEDDASEMYAYLRLFLVPDVAKRIFKTIHEY